MGIATPSHCFAENAEVRAVILHLPYVPAETQRCNKLLHTSTIN